MDDGRQARHQRDHEGRPPRSANAPGQSPHPPLHGGAERQGGPGVAKAKREVAAAIADERKLKAQFDDEVKQARDWEHRAMLAVKEGRDDLAKQALIRQQEHAERAQVIQQTWQEQAAQR